MSTMSDVLASNELQTGPTNPPPKNQVAIERLRKRMEGYREMQSSRMPQYDNHVNHLNGQQVQETLALRQKFLESKAKKPSKKSSAASQEAKMKHEMAAQGINGPASNMNGMMQYHNGPQGQGPQHNGPPMGHPAGPMANGPNGPMGNGPSGPMVANGPLMHHGGQGAGPVKRPLDEDERGATSDTAKRLNLENGAISDQNFMKREPSPMDTKYNPGGPGGPQFRGSPHQQGPGGPPHGPGGPPHGPPHSGANNQASPGGPVDVKPNVTSLKKEMESSGCSQSDSTKATKPPHNDTSDKDAVKEEVSDSFKKEAEDTLGDFDLKDFDLMDGMNNDTLQDLMDAVGDDLTENFIENFDFDSSSKMESDVKSEDLAKSEAAEAPPSSGAPTQTTSAPSGAPGGPAAGRGPPGAPAPNAAEALKLMAQQHQQPPASGAPGPGPPYPGPGGPYAGRGPGGPQGYMPPNPSAMSGGPPQGSPGPGAEGGGPPSQSPHHPSQSPHGGPQEPPNMGPRPQHGPQDADPRLRAAASQRFRLGNPQSMSGAMPTSMGGPGGPGMQGHPGMMSQRMPGMMGQMGGQGMMMSQQQVKHNLTPFQHK